jgi:hypothetical protein
MIVEVPHNMAVVTDAPEGTVLLQADSSARRTPPRYAAREG